MIAEDAAARSISFSISPVLTRHSLPARAGLPAISLKNDQVSRTNLDLRAVQKLRAVFRAAECATLDNVKILIISSRTGQLIRDRRFYFQNIFNRQKSDDDSTETETKGKQLLKFENWSNSHHPSRPGPGRAVAKGHFSMMILTTDIRIECFAVLRFPWP